MNERQPQRILVIDHDANERDRIGKLLSETFTPSYASNSIEALASFGAYRPSCVLLSDELPGDDSSALLDELVSRGAAVVVLTARASDANGVRALQHGAQDYFVKQKLNKDALRRVLSYAIERCKLTLENATAVSALQASEERFTELVSRIGEGLWLRTVDGAKCLYLSPAFERIWGRSIEEMNATTWGETVHPDDRAVGEQAFLSALRELREYQTSYRIVRPNGEIRFIQNRGFPMFDEHGNLVRMGGIARDITDERKLQEELRVAQKLESVGQLAAGIAHEINTPSQYVSDNILFLSDAMASLRTLLEGYNEALTLAQDSGANPERLEELRKLAVDLDLDYLLEEIPAALAQSQNGIKQIAKIVLAMKDFSHPGDEKVPADLNRAIESTMTVARNEWKYVADIELDFQEDLPKVHCVPSAMNQVILNILVNAAHAIGDVAANGRKGKITIQTREEPAGTVRISVSDDGCGIPESIRERIFDPFFTTKGVGKGTGQGLAIAYAIVKERHGGSITVESTVGQGTTFSIRLPVTPQTQDAHESQQSAA